MCVALPSGAAGPHRHTQTRPRICTTAHIQRPRAIDNSKQSVGCSSKWMPLVSESERNVDPVSWVVAGIREGGSRHLAARGCIGCREQRVLLWYATQGARTTPDLATYNSATAVLWYVA